MRLATIISKSAWALTLFLLIFAPTHAFFTTILLYKFNLVEVNVLGTAIKAWKELLILILALLAGLHLLLKKEKPQFVHWLMLTLITLGTIISYLNRDTLTLEQFIWGFRSEFTFWILLAALLIFVKEWSKEQNKTLLKGLAFSGVTVLLFGLFLMIIGHESLISLGYRDDWSTYFHNQAPAFCQKEGGTDYCRIQSLFTGPTRYGAYLIAMIPFFWYYFKNKAAKYTVIGLSLLSVGLALSYATWLGLFVALLVASGLKYSRWVKKNWHIIIGLVIITIFIGYILVISFTRDILLKPSDMLHLQYSLQAFQIIAKNPLGQGIGFMGPSTFKVDKFLISENWYLQLTANTGVLGLTLFLSIWYFLIKYLLKNRKHVIARMALFSTAAVLTQNYFLDTLVEVGMFAPLMFFIALGVHKSTSKILD